jgi:DNA-binding IclR family transcriptional regulator
MTLASTRGPAQPVQSVDRAMTLLTAVADADHAPTVAELAQQCDLNRSTAWRLLATLESHGLVERDLHGGGYSVGYAALRLSAAADMDSLARRVRPELESLAGRVGETVSLAVVRRFSLVYIDHVSLPGPAYERWTEHQLSLHSTSSGKIFLAWLSPGERDAALPRRLEAFTESTLVDRAALESDLATARETGYATCIGEDAQFTNGVSSAVLDARQRPIAVINVWGPERRVPPERLPALGTAAVETAARVATLLR